MAADFIMQLGVYVFIILFAFLMFLFFTAVLAVFVKREYKHYQPNVSVVIPCYNLEKILPKCLESIFALDYPKEKIEIVAVNDGSTDNTLKILKQFQKIHKNFVIVEGKHEGKSHSLNLGVKKSKYDIIFAVDGDTILEKNCLKKLVLPLGDEKVGAVNGSCIVRNNKSLLGIFQGIEYHYNSLIRKSFSKLFNNGIWFFGAFACYKKDVLNKIKGFKKDTMAEDMDTYMELYKAGYKTINIHDAHGYTLVPESFNGFFKQRSRWCMGGLQSLNKNKSLFWGKNPSMLFLFINQYWWAFFAFISFFIIGYQVYYWLPYNNQSFSALFMYLFRWFSLAGPVYVIYKIPVWGFSLYSAFGVLSGLISVFMIIWAIYSFNDRINIKNLFGIFFYFPYTILLNFIAAFSVIKIIFLKGGYFIY
jgi:cellulose synthase/poly-beta-1,6-N-acetylglucosamine synthase-like glycosyltransferase